MSEKLVWYTAAFAGTSLMATLGAFVRQISPGNELAIALGRFGFGLLCLAGFLALRSGPRRPRAWRLSWPLVGAGVFMPLFVVSYFKAVNTGTMANAAFLLYLGPLIASSLAALWLREGFSRLSGALLGLALLGTLLITETELPPRIDQAESLVFGLLSGLFYGLFLVVNNRKVQDDLTGLPAVAAQFLVATLVTAPLAALSAPSLTGADLAWIAAIGVIHGFVALTLVITALAHLRTVEYSTIAYGEPVIAALIGGLAYGESLSALQILGCALVISAGVARAFVSEQPGNAAALQSDTL